ncbi:hypothetical protein [Ensifer aridi]|uniref:hypothetical protein n=1 Tax=Ensifer aridi TaxID=1708715 RepID=UPI0009BFA331|nr:hypothetical protein [Ensifer aridi]
MTYVFEVIDDRGQCRVYIASHMRRKADKLIVRHRDAEVGIEIFRICDWCAVDEDEAPQFNGRRTGSFHDC